jgi:phosphoribosylpyrophosphate synthetase
MDSELIRFQTGEGKFSIAESVRGHDIYVITDVLSRNMEIDLIEGTQVISPDDHYMDLLRILSVLKGKAKRINVIMPFVYEGRREKLDSHRESYDCADMLKKLYKLGESARIKKAETIVMVPKGSPVTSHTNQARRKDRPLPIPKESPKPPSTYFNSVLLNAGRIKSATARTIIIHLTVANIHQSP